MKRDNRRQLLPPRNKSKGLPECPRHNDTPNWQDDPTGPAELDTDNLPAVWPIYRLSVRKIRKPAITS
jgi:hypothetical protein